MSIQRFTPLWRVIGSLRSFALALLFLTATTSRAAIRDGDIDTKNLGKGTWIYVLPNAVNHLGVGNISSVTNEMSISTWIDLTNVANTNGLVEFVESETNLPLRFYRAKPAP